MCLFLLDSSLDSATPSLLYVDGNLDAITASDPIGATSAPFLVGGVAVGSQLTGLYTGLIDDLQLYSGALSALEVQYLHQNPGVAIPNPSSSIPEPSPILGLLTIGLLGIAAARQRHP